MQEELEGIKQLIIEEIKKNKEISVQELSKTLFLNESVIWAAVNELNTEGIVFHPKPELVSLA